MGATNSLVPFPNGASFPNVNDKERNFFLIIDKAAHSIVGGRLSGKVEHKI